MRQAVNRRTLLRTAALAPFAGLAAGCGELARATGLGDFVRVAVTWSAAELAAFTQVLDGRGVRDYELIPLGDDISAALGARTTGRPDIVAVPQVGHVTANLDHLAPLPDGVWQDRYDDILQGAVVGDPHYALPFKLAHLSVVWYRGDLGITPPKTWDDWLALNEELVEDGLAPLALGAADGWVLAQFFQNVLLRTYRDTYDALLASREPDLWDSREVRSAFTMVATMWGRPGTLPGGAENALVRQFPDAVLEMCRYGRAAMVPAPDFAESVIRRFAPDPRDFATFTFPAGNAADEEPPLAVSSDLLVLTRPASDAAQGLISDLARPDAPVPWMRDTGGFIAANPHTDDRYYSDTLRPLAKDLREKEIRFGLADRLGRLGGPEGLERVLQHLLRGIADGTTPAEAARTACRAMVDAAHRTAS